MSQYYSQFETKLRRSLLQHHWPEESAKQTEVLSDWTRLLGKQGTIGLGTDGGRRVPRLTLGDVVKLAKGLRPDAFNSALERRLDDLVRMRNELTHRGSETIEFDLFVPFLGHAVAAQEVLRALEAEPQLPSEIAGTTGHEQTIKSE